jgi:hypothetical protein
MGVAPERIQTPRYKGSAPLLLVWVHVTCEVTCKRPKKDADTEGSRQKPSQLDCDANCMGRSEINTTLWLEIEDAKGMGVNGRIIIKWILTKYGWTGLD